MKLSTWAKQQGISYATAWNWFKEGKLPVKATQLPTGTILIKEEENKSITQRCVIYCRVSNHSRKDELEYQIKRCQEFCLNMGVSVDKVYKEIASGLNDNRREFWKALDSKPSILVIEHKDRLTRFGFNYLEKLLERLGCKIIVINRDSEDKADILKDLTSIIYSFCAKLYGMRRAQNKARKAQEVITNE